LDELAKSLSKNTLYKEKDIKSAEGSLALYVKSEAQLKTLTPAILDLAEATGMDLDSAAKLVGRTLESNVKTMGRLGVTVHGTAGSHERLDSIMKGLNERFGGSAKAMSDSQGEMAQLGKNIDEIGKSIGGFLVPVLNYWSKAFLDLKDSWDWILNAKEATEQHTNAVKKDNEQLSKSLEVANALKTGTGGAYEIINKEIAKYNDQIANSQKLQPGQIAEAKANLGHFKQLSEIIKSTGDNTAEAEKKIREFEGFIAKSSEEKGHKEKKPVTVIDPEANKRAFKEQQKLDKQFLDMVHDGEADQVEDMKVRLENQEKYTEEEKKLLEKRHNEELDIQMKNILIVDKLEKKEQSKTFAGRLKMLKQQHKEELEAFTGSERHRIKIAEGFAKEEAEFKKQEIEQKIGFDLQYASNTMNLMGQIAEATHANAQVMKRIKEGEAVVSAAKGALGVIENSAQFIANFGPVAGPIAMGVEIALMAGLAAVQISQIESAKMAYGGVVQGGTPGQDSVPAMLMPGEIVYNPSHPNSALASMINNSSTNNNNTNMHIYGPTININGSPDQKTIRHISQTTQRAIDNGVKQAMRNLQASGKLSGVLLRN
jgi:hypothetical protein